MFQNLKQGDTLYILDKTGIPMLKEGIVVSVGNPTPVYNTQTSGITLGFQNAMEVSVRANVENTEGDFAHLPLSDSVHDYGTMVIADNREAMVSEVDKVRAKAQGELDRDAQNRETVAACDEMFKTLNPNYAKEKERDEAIGNLSSRLDGIESNMSQILKLLNKK